MHQLTFSNERHFQMDFQNYRPLALRTAKWFPNQRDNIRHATLGMITEMGEFSTIIKRHVIYGKPVDDAMRENMCEEIGDFLWYLPLLLEAIGHTGPLPVPAEGDGLASFPNFNLQDPGDWPLIVTFMSAAVVMTIADQEAGDDLPLKVVQMLVELVDDHIAPWLGTTGDELRAQNIEKLRQRFPDKYSDEAAEARADKGGLTALES